MLCFCGSRYEHFKAAHNMCFWKDLWNSWKMFCARSCFYSGCIFRQNDNGLVYMYMSSVAEIGKFLVMILKGWNPLMTSFVEIELYWVHLHTLWDECFKESCFWKLYTCKFPVVCVRFLILVLDWMLYTPPKAKVGSLLFLLLLLLGGGVGKD